MAEFNNEQLLKYLKEVEQSAEDVLSDRQEIIDLDRRRNTNREAIRGIEQTCRSSYKGDEAKMWLAMGNTFFRLPCRTARTMLQKDQVQLDKEINILRSDLKVKVNSLQEKQGRPELKGLHLKALSPDELNAVRKVIGPNPSR